MVLAATVDVIAATAAAGAEAGEDAVTVTPAGGVAGPVATGTIAVAVTGTCTAEVADTGTDVVPVTGTGTTTTLEFRDLTQLTTPQIHTPMISRTSMTSSENMVKFTRFLVSDLDESQILGMMSLYTILSRNAK